jgi:hypothetical protein
VSDVRVFLDALLGILSTAVAPRKVALATEGAAESDAPIQVRALSVERVGRSRGEGPALDLRLVVRVLCGGPTAIDDIEALLVALETGPYTVTPLDRAELAAGDLRLGFIASVPVSVALAETRGPRVEKPLVVNPELIPT